MKYCLLNRTISLEVLHNDPLEQFWRHRFVPDAIGINDYNRTFSADTEARCFAALHARGTEQQVFAFEQARQLRV